MNKEEIKQKIENTTDRKEKIALEGKLISFIKKEIKNTKDPILKQNLRVELYEELKKHKETIKNIKSSQQEKIPLSEKIGLKIKEIATAINIWSEKHDVIQKLKNAAVSTVFSTITCLGIQTGIGLITGGVLTLPALATILPLASYIGLSNLVTMPFHKTAYEEFLEKYENKDEITMKVQGFVQENIINNKEYLQLANEKISIFKEKDIDKQIEIDEKLIEEMKKIVSKAEIDECKYTLTAELVALMKELRNLYNKKKKDYIKDNNAMTTQEFAQLEKKSLSLDADIFMKENYVTEVGKEGLKNFTINKASMFAIRAALSVVFPQYAIHNVQDLLTPFILSLINNTTSLNQIRDKIKMKESKYLNQVIRFKNEELLKQIIQKESIGMNRSIA